MGLLTGLVMSLIARSRTSAGYFLDAGMTTTLPWLQASHQSGEPQPNPGRFTAVPLTTVVNHTIHPSTITRLTTKRRAWDSNPRERSPVLAVFKTAAIVH